jgi:hypothetical protein
MTLVGFEQAMLEIGRLERHNAQPRIIDNNGDITPQISARWLGLNALHALLNRQCFAF